MKCKMTLLGLIGLGLGATPVWSDAPKTDAPKTIGSSATVPNSAEDIRPILVGSKLPPISLRDTKGKTLSLNATIARKPSVLIFYRGGWCPFCNTHLSSLRATEAPLQKLGYDILAISPDSAANLDATIQKNKLGYQLLSDSTMAAARALGIAFRMDDETLKKYREYGIDLEKSSGETHHQLPAPAVFLVGRDGTIHFSYVNPNYKVRLAPEVLIAAARAYQKDAAKAPK